MRGTNRVSSKLLALTSFYFLIGCGNGKDPAFKAAGKLQLESEQSLKLNSEGGTVVDVLPGAAQLEVFKNRVVLDNGLARMPFFFDPKSFTTKHALYAITNLSSEVRIIGSGYSMKQPVDLFGRKEVEIIKEEEIRTQIPCVLRTDMIFMGFTQVGDAQIPNYIYDTVYGVQDIIQKVTVYKETYFFSLAKIGEKEAVASFESMIPLKENRETVKVLSGCH